MSESDSDLNGSDTDLSENDSDLTGSDTDLSESDSESNSIEIDIIKRNKELNDSDIPDLNIIKASVNSMVDTIAQSDLVNINISGSNNRLSKILEDDSNFKLGEDHSVESDLNDDGVRIKLNNYKNDIGLESASETDFDIIKQLVSSMVDTIAQSEIIENLSVSDIDFSGSGKGLYDSRGTLSDFFDSDFENDFHHFDKENIISPFDMENGNLVKSDFHDQDHLVEGDLNDAASEGGVSIELDIDIENLGSDVAPEPDVEIVRSLIDSLVDTVVESKWLIIQILKQKTIFNDTSYTKFTSIDNFWKF